jgi:hypothetical protein
MLFMQVADKMPTKYKLFQSFFAYTSVFKDKKSKKSQNSKIRVSYFFCMLMVSMIWYVDFYELFVLWVGRSGVWVKNHPLLPTPQPPDVGVGGRGE